ncbi:endonuclease/exonuclease/phosphatase family protein [Brevibacillus migulae]|uniref:endonuclease/exonuclease/phosphatase family protein n=1 Tax=Brevibacillus migulae TaxID=1644114 RepID=UPI00142FE6AD|nr:endonuclease/exonuclease/phosphatase family protein [Brevibacillus migulae]
MRIVSYNIHGGKDLFMRKRLDQMAETLSSLEADIIGLQEVHQNNRSGYQAAYLAERLQTSYAYGPALPIADGSYGNALLTKHPLVFSTVKSLPAKKEPRSLLQTTVKWDNRYLDFWVTHFSLDESSREAQVEALRKEIAPLNDKPLVLLGDFNSRHTEFTPHLLDCGRIQHMHRLSTLVPFSKRVDYIFVSSQWKVTEYQRIDVKWSDHYPILVTLQLAEP